MLIFSPERPLSLFEPYALGNAAPSPAMSGNEENETALPSNVFEATEVKKLNRRKRSQL